jgi:capsular exopolysaccharide synthesis family protein
MPDDFNIAHLVALLRRQLVWVVVTAAVCAGAAYGVSKQQTPKYHSSATILYTAPQSALAATTTPDDRALATYVGLVETDPVLSQSAVALGTTRVAVQKAISVKGATDADLITITASAGSPQEAQRIANVVSETFLAWRSRINKSVVAARVASLRSQLAQLRGSTAPADVTAAGDLRTQLAEANAELAAPDTILTLANPAQPPTGPYTPHPIRSLVIGLLAGLLLGTMGVFLFDRLDRRLHTVEEVELAYDAPVLGTIPVIKEAERGDRTAALADFSSANLLADSFRQIRTNLELFRLDGSDQQVIVVSSAVPGEGKSAVAANLAVAYASRGKRVLALSADLRSPALHEYFATKYEDGLFRALLGREDLAQAVREVPLNGATSDRKGQRGGSLALLGTVQTIRDPAAILQSESMAKLLKKARENFDTIVVDAPPLLVGAEAHLLAQHADALVLVSRVGKLTRNDARRAVRSLQATELAAIGLVVTGRPLEGEAYGYGYGYGRGYGYGATHQRQEPRTTSHL